jgi:hypothetical protein
MVPVVHAFDCGYSHFMFTYSDGMAVEVGDSVLIERGRTPGTVELLVCTEGEIKAMGVSEPGVMLLSPPFGRIYLPASSLGEDPLIFVSRAAKE